MNKNLLKENYKQLIHADIGALVVKEWYNFDDEMCNAIKYHTLGNNTMTILEKIIFIADKIGRKNTPDDLIEVKNLAYKDLDKALLLFLKKQESYLKEEDKDLYPQTKELIKNLKAQ